MSYDPQNIFARILRGEIPANKVYEDDAVLAFRDIDPKRKVHVLIIPKSAYANATHFCEEAKDDEIVALMRAVPKVAEAVGVKSAGYRLIVNCGDHGGQEVPHLHIHMLGGEVVGKMVA